MRDLVEQLSRRGIPYGIRKDGSLFVMQNGFDIVELGGKELPIETPADDNWMLMDGRWVMKEARL